jgi:hypothetical protein
MNSAKGSTLLVVDFLFKGAFHHFQYFVAKQLEIATSYLGSFVSLCPLPHVRLPSASLVRIPPLYDSFLENSTTVKGEVA